MTAEVIITVKALFVLGCLILLRWTTVSERKDKERDKG